MTTRRVMATAVVGGVAAIVVLASCGSSGPSAATVNGADIPRSDFEDDLDALAGLDGLVSQPVPENGSWSGDDVRFWLGVAIENELKLQEVAAAGDDLATRGFDHPRAIQPLRHHLGEPLETRRRARRRRARRPCPETSRSDDGPAHRRRRASMS